MSSLLLIFFTFLSVLIGLMSSGWVIIVLMMELGLFFFIFMCLEYKSLSYTRSSIKYFFVQSLGSLLLFVGGVMLFALQGSSYMCHFIFLTGLVAKLGAFPLFFWVVPVSLELPYMMMGIVGCPLKILPISVYMMYYGLGNPLIFSWVMNTVSLMTMLCGVWLGLYLKTVRGVLGASSITHTGWFILSVHTSSFLMYFGLYSVSFLLLLWFLATRDMLLSSLGLLGLGGLPPFSVFVGKMTVVLAGVSWNTPSVLLVTALVVSAISLYYYLKFSFNMYMYDTMSFRLRSVSMCFFMLVNTSSIAVFCYLFFYGRVMAVDF